MINPKDPQLVKFGFKVRSFRKMQGISIEELAFRCNMSRNYLNDVELGRRNVSFINIIKIAEGLNIPPYVLFVD